MPIVINLLSSPELPNTAGAITKTNVPAKPLYTSKPVVDEFKKARKRKNDDWHVLSDSDDEPVSLPPAKLAPKLSSSTSLEAESTNKSKPSNDFFFHSDDFDSTVNLDDPFASSPPLAKKQRPSPPLGTSISRSPAFQQWVISKLERSTNPRPPNIVEQNTKTAPSSLSYSRLVSDIGASSKPVVSKNAAPSQSSYKRSVSDVGGSSKSTALKTRSSGKKRSKTMSSAFESDPIVFTSSPDPRTEEARGRKERVNRILVGSSDEDEFERRPPKESTQKGRRKEQIDQILVSSSDFENFDGRTSKKSKGKPRSSEKEKTSGNVALASRHGNALRDFEFDESSDLDLPDLGAIPSQVISKAGKVTVKSSATIALERYEAEKAKENKEKEKEQKLKTRESKSKDKVTAKEAGKEQKRLAKEEKARERDRAADLAKANLLRTDKKKSTPEMIVDLPSCLNPILAGKVPGYLAAVEAEHSEWESSQPIIKWRRKVGFEYNEEADHWERVEPYIRQENHVMYLMTAKEFVDLVTTTEEGRDLDYHVLQLKARFNTKQIIYLIEGLEPFMRKNKNAQNRKFVQEVRNQIPEEPSAGQKRKKKAEPDRVDEDLVEDALLKLQVMHSVLIHHTHATIETAEWVVVFTQHISTIPYRALKQSLDTAFCMESGQVKAGDGPADTFTRMLQEMVRITPSVAYGVVAEYPTVQKLVKGFKENGALCLEDCRKTANKDGTFTDKRIGPSVSKRVYNVFMSRDPGNENV